MSKLSVPFSPPDITDAEINAVVEVLKSGWITTGPKTKEFEKKIAEYVGAARAVCLNSATAALELGLRLFEIGEGDEVIVPAYTYTASASVVDHVGAKLVLVDVEAGTFHFDYDKLAEAITDKTKAIIPVDFAGTMSDYEKIFEIVEAKKNIFKPSSSYQKALGRILVLADSAHGFGAAAKFRGKLVKSGSIADLTAFSFHAVKNLTTAEGGALSWNSIPGIEDEDTYKKLQLFSLHGQNKDALAKTKAGAWEYDIIGTYYKCNMTDIMAAIGLVQFDRYPELLKRRRDMIETYKKGIESDRVHILEHFTDDYQSSGHLMIVRVDGYDVEQRNALITAMAEDGVSTNVHYKPLPMHTAYKKLGFDIKDYPNSYDMYKNEITLPLHTKLSDEDLAYVIETFNKYV
ncbi:DegT/DnrJ/EryC1/StrS family aminotransferase [Lachnospira multipara]|uniref:dTDP-4-amino-4,6-dideoxygalactose transaminase n=1 Tax=Lachnospira multipara TaxID=28051 RepID=A0A1H5WU96_9FIRM|nr:DegT/DnrJ/EryC1/StrS family aminotransferase [Lachnospira multipara]SEG02865.1 dTDP-4-amino-4,6-dideoxygalactose transaminase [Lachnospira multipara]